MELFGMWVDLLNSMSEIDIEAVIIVNIDFTQTLHVHIFLFTWNGVRFWIGSSLPAAMIIVVVENIGKTA